LEKLITLEKQKAGILPKFTIQEKIKNTREDFSQISQILANISHLEHNFIPLGDKAAAVVVFLYSLSLSRSFSQSSLEDVLIKKRDLLSDESVADPITEIVFFSPLFSYFYFPTTFSSFYINSNFLLSLANHNLNPSSLPLTHLLRLMTSNTAFIILTIRWKRTSVRTLLHLTLQK
jgi:hypothetical protein